MTEQYIAPQLTRYGKIEHLVQGGSLLVELESGDITGDGQTDTAFDTNGDGKADVVVGGAGGQTNIALVTNLTSRDGVNADFYDSDEDGQADFAIAQGSLQKIYFYSFGSSFLSETRYFYSPRIYRFIEGSRNGGWDDPARD